MSSNFISRAPFFIALEGFRVSNGNNSRKIRLLQCVAAGALVVCATSCSDRQQNGSEPTEAIRAAWQFYRAGEFTGAANSFEDVLNSSLEAEPIYAQALYGLAVTWDLRRPDPNKALAKKYYEQLLVLAPEGELAPWTLLALARMEHLVPVGQAPNWEAARAVYGRTAEKFPFHPAGEEAFLHLQSTWIQTLDVEAARKAKSEVEFFLTSHPQTKFKSAAYGLIGDSLTILNAPAQERLEAALKSLEFREIDPSNPLIDRAASYWSVATMAEFDAGDFETARKYYGQLINEYPNDFRVYPAKLALERMQSVERDARLSGGKITSALVP